MSQPCSYAIARMHDDCYRLDRTTPPAAGPAAFVIRMRDRLGNPIGWKLKPLVTMQGAKSHVFPSAADAIAATKLMTPGQARTAITRVGVIAPPPPNPVAGVQP